MAKKITLENLARMIKKGFDENTKQHRQIFDRLVVIEKKLEGIVYRKEFEELEKRIKIIEEALAIKK
jgi:hypothetical protein